jgi:hypothetical protein
MARKRKAKRTGRPPASLTEAQWKTVERMARAMCTQKEIAEYLGIARHTLMGVGLKERFESIFRMKQAATRLDVREHQLEQALGKGPVGMIWWGKQHLGQTDRQVVAPPEGGPMDQIQGAAQRLVEVLDKLAKRQGAA